MKTIDESSFEHLKDFFDVFNYESPRGMVIIAAAELEDHLQKIIGEYLESQPSEIHNCFESNLTNFAGKIQTAFSLKLIDKKIKDDLDLFRQIRNEFAHSSFEINFESEQIINYCKKFKNTIPFDHFPNTPINQFKGAFSMVMSKLEIILFGISK